MQSPAPTFQILPQITWDIRSLYVRCVSKIHNLTNASTSHYISGESVDDCGGGYSESVAEMCDELQNGSLPLLVVTPNGREESGANRDCFVIDSSADSALELNMFKFLGKRLCFCSCLFDSTLLFI